jgi:hypothetical protein
MKTRDQQIDFIRMNGVRVASCAWNGFEKKGRGLVCVLSDLENELQRTVPFDFMPAADASKLFKPWVGTLTVTKSGPRPHHRMLLNRSDHAALVLEFDGWMGLQSG